MLDFVGKRRWFFLASGVVILVGVISLIAFGLTAGIEFSSGSTMTVRFEQPVTQADLRQEMTNLGHEEAIIQRTGEGDFIIRTRELAEEVRDPQTGEVITPAERDTVEAALAERFGPVTVLDFYSVSPIVSAEIGRNALYAVLAAAVGILLYITWAFRKLMRSVRYGVCALIALGHDVLVVVGLFSLLGWIMGIEVDVMFITGILTVIGYSVNNTIVVFDRIRENAARSPGTSLDIIINNSILDTVGRSLNTSLTTLFVLLALFLIGGVTIHNFILVLLIGVISGTYSSMCISGPLLIVWQNREVRGLFSRMRRKLAPVRG